MNVVVEPRILHGDARALPLPDESVDLIVTSPPYFGLRDYGHDTQIGAEATPQEFIAALVECTAEMVRVLKPSGSIFVNLGDKYAGGGMGGHGGGRLNGKVGQGALERGYGRRKLVGVPNKSLMLLPERYRIACTDELGLIARAVVVWSKPNGLPESVTDRVRRSHEDWVHLVRQPRYFSAVDEIREPQRTIVTETGAVRYRKPGEQVNTARKSVTAANKYTGTGATGDIKSGANPLGKLPGSVWEIATQPMRVPAELGVDHFAAFPMEWPRRLILGWSPREVCTACGEGRRPVAAETGRVVASDGRDRFGAYADRRARGETTGPQRQSSGAGTASMPKRERVLAGYACACPDTAAPSTPGVVLDPFGGTGTTALVAAMHGRQGISVDASADYCRLAEWRCSDPKQRERASRAAGSKPSKQPPPQPAPVVVEETQPDLFGEAAA